MDDRTSLTVSVALCTHNGAAFVGPQVDSILGQTRPPDELVVSDDDSTDDTVRVVRERVEAYRAGGGTISMQLLENRPALGIAANFAQAISNCHSDLVALSDQDDVWHPQRLEVIARYFADHPEVALVHGDARRIDSAGLPLSGSLFDSLRVSRGERHRIDRGDALSVLIRRNVVTGATSVFRRSLVAQALPIPPGWIHDEWFAIVASLVGAGRHRPRAMGRLPPARRKPDRRREAHGARPGVATARARGRAEPAPVDASRLARRALRIRSGSSESPRRVLFAASCGTSSSAPRCRRSGSAGWYRCLPS